MSRILLADDSPHAQRMGEFILREDGYEVVSVTDGATAIMRLADVDPDVVLADVSLPQTDGYELCRHIKTHPGHRHAKVVLTAGAMEPIDVEQAGLVHADGSLRKPFEASAVTEIVKRLVEESRLAREAQVEVDPSPDAESASEPAEETVEFPAAEAPVAEVSVQAETEPAVATLSLPQSDPEAVRAAVRLAFENALGVVQTEVVPASEVRSRPQANPEAVRAAVTLALDSALPVLIDEITQRVLAALGDEEDLTG